MNFAHYNDQAVGIAVDLVNSLGSISGNEYLPDDDSVREFLELRGVEAPRRITTRDVEELRQLRARLRAVFEAPTEERAARLLNELLAEARTLPQITNHDGQVWHFHYTPAEASVAQRITAIAAMGLATVICEFGHERLGICSADRCRDVFVDTSRNRSRRYCNETCSTRMNVAAYRARHRART